MRGWRQHNGQAVALPLESIDTDQLIPARFMSTPRSAGYGRFLLHDMRFDTNGASNPACVLNAFPEASVLVTRRNFGSGSSREAAVYALVDFGFRAVFAPGFGDIFAANAVNNGLLPAVIAPEIAEILIDRLGQTDGDAVIDLTTLKARVAGLDLEFSLADVPRSKLINGWDDIDVTCRHANEIAAYRSARRNLPGAWPASAGE